jgi:glutaredoxin 3
MIMNIEIYSKDNCSFCTQAKNFFLQRGMEYVEFKIGSTYTVEQFKQKFPTARTVPQIVIDGSHIGGYDQLQEWAVNYDKSKFIQD